MKIANTQGYYWCRTGGREEPVEWTGKEWWGIAMLRPYTSDEIEEVICALTPPAIAGPADAVARIVHLRADRERRIYIAGPMTGLPGYNFAAFNAKAAELRAEGWHVENPAEHGHIDGAGWADYLRWDISRIATCGAIYLLPGWQASKGASLEVAIGKALGVQFLGEPVTEPAPLAWVVECKIGGAWVPQFPPRFAEVHAVADMEMFKTPFKRVTPLVPALDGQA